MHTRTPLRPTLTLLAAVALAVPHTANGFAEDVCYLADGGGITSCLPLPAVCRPVPTDSAACKLAVLRLATVGAQGYVGGRSSIHTDVTYVLAQAVGFSATDAYWIAAYDEATDTGQFTPRDNQARPVGDGALTTANVDGLRRTNFDTGGVLLHYVAPYNDGRDTPPRGIDGLHPDATDPFVEVTLANYRAWAFARSSDAVAACTGGLTIPSDDGDLATGPACWATGTAIDGVVSVVGPIDLPLATQTGPQFLDDDGTILADDLDALVATDGANDPSRAHASDARIGVYLHVLADRISHHQCGDRSVISGPDADGFHVDLGDPECNQPIHFLRHAWETGVPFLRLDPADRTTIAVLQEVYDELVDFARARGVLRPAARNPAVRADLLLRLAVALQRVDAVERVTAISAVGCRWGLEPMPGQPACR